MVGTVIVIVIMTRVQECAPFILRRDLAYIAAHSLLEVRYMCCPFQRLLLLLLLKDKRYFSIKKPKMSLVLLVLPFCAIK